MSQQLSLSARPRTLDALVGQEKMVASIRGHIKAGRTIKAWLFSGSRGQGKTTASRILALSLQCTHQTIFGSPCKECQRDKAQFPIYEINAADSTGIDKIRDALQGSEYGVLGAGSYRVYILDELHRLSEQAQSLLLKYLEDTPESTVFILCSTHPYKIIDTVRSRCIFYELKGLGPDDILLLVTRLLKRVKSILPADRLADALVDQKIDSPRLIAQAVEKYVASEDVEEASKVDNSSLDVRSITKAVTKGDWVETARALQAAEGADIRAVRGSMVAYLRVILLESQDYSERNRAVAKAITALAALDNTTDQVVAAALAAELYRLAEMFNKYQL